MSIKPPERIELPTGMQMGSVNAYLFKEPEPILVDTGLKSDESWEALQLGLAEHGLTVIDISRIIITHAHVDHDGQAGQIVDQSDADVWISELGAPWLQFTAEQRARRATYYYEQFLPATGFDQSIIGTITSGLNSMGDQRAPIAPDRIHAFPIDGVLQMGGVPWQVLYTPGHASMQTCFYQPDNRLLLSADMLLASTPVPVVESPTDGSTERVPGLPVFMKSLDLIESLEVDLVLPGHGRSFADHHQVIQRQRERIALRKEECRQWIEQGIITPVDLVEKMYAHRPIQTRFAGLWMLIGYLDLLEAEGVIERQTIGGIWHYYPC
ncbi:MAG: MBL fold metallo-hydrolase [Candidatus Promineifilaceae bacterium]|nr:MBL fold metallo-hydrolase [Candidatus Promineifilaceae bacterium]